MSLYVNIPPASSAAFAWASNEATFHNSLGYGFTQTVLILCGQAPTGASLATNIADAGKEGGAIKGINSSWTQLVAPKVYQNAATSKFAVSYYGNLGTNGVGFVSFFGICQTATANAVLIGTNNSLDATNFVLYGNDGTPTTIGASQQLGVSNTSAHTFRLTSNSTTVSAYIDGVVKGTLATNATHYPTVAMAPGLLEGGTPTVAGALYWVLYSFVGPNP